MPCCPHLSAPCSSSLAAPLLGCPWEVPRDASPFLHHSLLAPLLLLTAGLRVLSQRGQGSRRAPITDGLAPPLPLMGLPARPDVQGCPTDPGPRACLLCLLCRQGLISLAAATKRVNTLQGISSALHRLFCLLLN